MPRKFFFIAVSLVSSKQAISMLAVTSSKSSTNTTTLIVTERGNVHTIFFSFCLGWYFGGAYTVTGEAQRLWGARIQR